MAAYALPKSARLSRRADFANVRERGRSFHGRCMVLGGWMSGGDDAARCGVITSRKVGSAAERVRTRRRLREIFRLHRGSLPAGLWLVVVARRAAVAAPHAALAGEWRSLAERAGYLKS